MCSKQIPSKVKISDISFKNIKGTSTTPLAVNFICSWSVPCENVEIADIDLMYTGEKGFITSQCWHVKLATIFNVTNDLACGNYPPYSKSKSHNKKGPYPTIISRSNQTKAISRLKNQTEANCPAGRYEHVYTLIVTSSATNSHTTYWWLLPTAVLQLLIWGFWFLLHEWL